MGCMGKVGGRYVRPKCTKELAERAFSTLSKGKNIAQTAKELGLRSSDFEYYVSKYPYFRTAVDDGVKACEAYWSNIADMSALGLPIEHNGIERFSNAALLKFVLNNKIGWVEHKEKKDSDAADMRVLGELLEDVNV
jgi:hypothetical protein